MQQQRYHHTTAWIGYYIDAVEWSRVSTRRCYFYLHTNVYRIDKHIDVINTCVYYIHNWHNMQARGGAGLQAYYLIIYDMAGIY